MTGKKTGTRAMRDHMLQAKEDAVKATLETTLMAIGAE
jgi:hypothetical protein